ncbi:MAG: septum formation protein Maf [Anaerolineae bacterium]|jgi:MAF protein|nr:septum formation protein Maf [Anaerolineae bacterium]MBT3712044.1 septum formation protein Maf [Anaerolineae bacterium]MBT4308899.1 septum formation protein Maf [Anaerolineae bacterium]MBT4459050.1 septum formation protein Maf [Anaerolineae bacterium]MBT6320792.1 septum formation protein Maf [Anaerolineae bacterium]
MKKENTLLLASQSPRRRELLSFTGLGFDVASADVDEGILPDEETASYVLRLAEAKARASASQPSPSALSQGERGLVVIGSDTAVVDAGETLGKPQDTREAESMLRQLRGRTHQVYTAIAIYDETSDKGFSELCISDVPMREYSDDEMSAYIQTGDPMDKAGGYAIQHPEFQPVESFAGCFASVMGLPLCHLARILKKVDVDVQADLPLVCQSSLGYECTISDAVLLGENLG